MKRFIAILMLFVYSLSISGMVLQLHYCDDNLKSLKLANNEKNKCCCPKKTNQQHKKSCCGETKVVLKLNIDQSNHYQLAQFKVTDWQHKYLFFNSHIVFYTSTLSGLELINIDINKDVGKPKIPRYKLFKQIVYYG